MNKQVIGNCTCSDVSDFKLKAVKMYLLKRGTIWNDLKQPTTTWNDLQRTRNDLKWPTTSKTQPTTTWTYQQQAKEDSERPTTNRFWDYFAIWCNLFSSLSGFPPNIWLQSFKHFFMENHGKNWGSSICIQSCISTFAN